MLPEEEQMIGEDCWVEVTKKMPIPCVDVIVCRSQKFLMGWRIIPPYKNVWALPGGRMFRGESFIQTAMRQCAKSGLKIRNLRCIGLYPVRFPSRHDITACVVAQWESGTPVPTNEFSRYTWFGACEIREIRPIGANYRKMLQDWQGTSVPWSTTMADHHKREIAYEA